MRDQAQTLFLILSGVFIATLVSCNLIFQKFFSWSPFGLYTFELSVGILPYPLTFLITDLISEIYGKKKANEVVIAGIFASLFSMGIILLANLVPALENSPVSDALFERVFALSPIAVFASMIAYLSAQFVDIRIYHFWKKFTHGKHLWLRNNFSTFSSQLIDTVAVIGLLCVFKILSWDQFLGLVISSFLFKILIAFLDTPFLYFFVFLFRKKFNLAPQDEIKI